MAQTVHFYGLMTPPLAEPHGGDVPKRPLRFSWRSLVCFVGILLGLTLIVLSSGSVAAHVFMPGSTEDSLDTSGFQQALLALAFGVFIVGFSIFSWLRPPASD